MRAPRRILIIKPSSLGDIVHALPLLAGLRARYPRAHIAWLVGTSFAGLLEGHPDIDELILFDRKRYGKLWRNFRALAEFVRFVAGLRRRRFDLVIDLQGLVRSGLFSIFCGAPERVGFDEAREFAWPCYTRRVRTGRGPLHAVERVLRLAEALRLPARPPRFPLPRSERADIRVQGLIAAAVGEPVKEWTAIVPGARWASKQWPARHFAALIDALHNDGRPRCVLIGGPDDAALAAEITRATRAPVVDLTGRTQLGDLVPLLAGAELVVSCDSGPMHIAAALGVAQVALFGPTDPARTGPFSALAKVVQRTLDCRPCLRRICPLGHQACLDQLSADAVLATVRDLAPSAPRMQLRSDAAPEPISARFD